MAFTTVTEEAPSHTAEEYSREGPYRRAIEPFRYWLGMALAGFLFVFATLGAVLMLFLMVSVFVMLLAKH